MTELKRHDDSLLENHILVEEERQKTMEARLEKIETQMADMLTIWQQAKGALAFIKLLAGLAAAVGAVYAFVNGHFSITPK